MTEHPAPIPSSPTPTTNPLVRILKFLGKAWLVGTALIGTFVVLGIAMLIIAIASLSQDDASSSNQQPFSEKIIHKAGKDKIAVVYLNGPISETSDSSGFAASDTAVSSKKLIKLLDFIEQKDDIKAVVLRINSPGGTVVASDEIYQRVMKLKQKKIVISSLGDTAASGGYYIAAGTNRIVANPATLTGSIGVIAQLPRLSGLYEKIGVEMRTFKSGKFKDIGSESREVTSEENEIFNSIITDSYDQFVAAIAAGRSMDAAKVRQLADGRIYTGKQAKANGLVDELGNLETAINLAKDLSKASDPTLVEYSTGGFFEALFNSTSKLFPNTESAIMSELKEFLPKNQFGVYYLMQ